ncbi:MAG TPA: polyprenyl diphosphate synthase [Gemmatimonadaceae bacterium]|nr:polyprenyl diphosphate synthase [Gemmatimonadaceae bacterium]
MRRTTALHAAIIMDGNGRWATARGMPRVAGHRAGADAVRRTVEAAPRLGIDTLTLYAFSTDNWKRPPREVATLMRLFRSHLRSETPRLVENGVRLSVIGRRDRLALPLQTEIAATEDATAHGATLHLRLAIDYSARDAILQAALRTAARAHGGHNGAPPLDLATEDNRARAHMWFARALADAYGSDEAPDVDLLIRTGGEQRLSDFMLWECAYAELYFAPCMWPEFDEAALAAAVHDFHGRQRRFGAVPKVAG